MNPRTFTREQIEQVLKNNGITYKINGREIDADIDGIGHHSYKISARKGVYLDASTGKGGTIYGLLRRIGATPAPAGNGAAFGGHNSGTTTTDDVKRLWDAGWTCTHAQDVPTGWDKGLNASQKGCHRAKLEKQRDTVRAYLASRLGPDHLDHWSRQVRIGKNGLMLNPMQNRGVITGIQRTYFDQSGQKSERKMLGPQGTTFCPVPSGVNPRDLGVGAVKLVGEGWETVASTVQAVGWPGLACQFDGGIVKWAQEQASKFMTPEQLAAAPAVVVMADRDLSHAGQRASARAVKILRGAGLKAYYAIPPSPENGGPKGGPRGSDWGDYPREGINADVLCAHLALSCACEDMPAVDEPGMVLSSSAQIRNWRPAANPQTPAQCGPTHEIRADLQTALQRTVSDYLTWLRDKNTHFAPVLMMPTTGTGKSTAANSLIWNLELRQDGGRVCVFVPDHTQAGEYERSGFFHFYGRNAKSTHPGYCPNHLCAQEAMDKGHISQPEICFHCSNGLKWKANQINDSGKIKKIKQELEARGLNFENVTPCVWQTHLRDALKAQFVVASSGSYSHNLTRGALVIFDEHFEPGKGVHVTLQDIDQWCRRNQEIIKNIINYCEDYDDDAALDALDRYRKADEFFRQLSLSVASWVGKTGSVQTDPSLLDTIHRLLESSKKRSNDEVETAAWETLRFNRAGELVENPLRAAHAIAQTLSLGDGYVHAGQIVVAHSLPVMERLAKGEPTVVMDATPDPVIFDVVQAQGGQIVNAIARQNVRIHRYPTRFSGLTQLNSKRSGVDRVEREIIKYTKLVDHHSGSVETAFLFHKKAYDALDLSNYRFDHDGDPVAYKSFPHIKLGDFDYWGRGHRAHNRWSGKSLVIVGSFFPPLEAWRAEYQVCRVSALRAGAKADRWPAWRDDMLMMKDYWICEGDTDVQCRLPLPADTHIREWLLNRITSETVQSIGRARGANAENVIDIHIYGGVPLHGLWQHGLAVDSYEADPECLGQTKAGHLAAMQSQHEESLARLDRAAARLISQGRKITREDLQSEVSLAVQMENGGAEDLFQGGIYIHTTLEQIKNEDGSARGAPRDETVKEWFKTRMPILSRHLSTKGRNGKLVKAAQAVARRFGEEMLAEAMQIAENIIISTKSADAAANASWNKIEDDPLARQVEIVGARLVLEGLGKTEGVAPPWEDSAVSNAGEVPL